MLAGLSQVNIELTARCNARCSWCGHQNPTHNPDIANAGDIDFDLLHHIAEQIPIGIVVQFHRDGEPTLYPRLGAALRMFEGCIRSIVTNGINLGERAEEIIGNCEAVCVSISPGLAHEPEQLRALNHFLRAQDGRLPRVILKLLGDVPADIEALARRGVSVIRRRLHAPQRNVAYRGGSPEGWEHGLCTDLLSHPSIDWRGDLFLCNRLDPTGVRRLGSLREKSLAELWNGPERAAVIRAHIEGRAESVPQCVGCEYRGLPAV